MDTEDAPSMTVAIINDYASLHSALRARADALRVSRSDLDDIAGLATGHVSKLLAPNFTKLLGPLSFGLVLQALGLRLRVEVDPEQTAKLASRYRPRDERKVTKRANPSDQVIITLSRARLRRLASLGGKATAERLTYAQRRRAAQKAARARWARRAVA